MSDIDIQVVERMEQRYPPIKEIIDSMIDNGYIKKEFATKFYCNLDLASTSIDSDSIKPITILGSMSMAIDDTPDNLDECYFVYDSLTRENQYQMTITKGILEISDPYGVGFIHYIGINSLGIVKLDSRYPFYFFRELKNAEIFAEFFRRIAKECRNICRIL